MTAHAQVVFTLRGTGADAGIVIQVVGPNPLPLGSNSLIIVPRPFLVCTVPAGEFCDGPSDFDYSPASGIARLREGAGRPNHTWFFPPFLHNEYSTTLATSADSGVLLIVGIDATAGTPQANATNAVFQFPLEATVTGPNAAYEKGDTVTFTAPGGPGPSAILPGGGVVTTDANGRASITPIANGTAGAYRITAKATLASLGGQSVSYTYVLANMNTANASGACV